jgi:UDPglucose 6-dehydrogenase
MDKAKELPFASKIKFATSASKPPKVPKPSSSPPSGPNSPPSISRAARAMRTPMIFDGRNLIDPVAAKRLRLPIPGIGRGVTPERVE